MGRLGSLVLIRADQARKNASRDGVDSVAMDDDTVAAETAVAAGADDTAVVLDCTPTGIVERAWSHEEPRADVSTSKDVQPYRKRGVARWAVSLVALLLAGASALWLGTVLYRDENSAAPVKPALTRPVETPAPVPPPAALPVPAAAPAPLPPAPEPPHPAAIYPWVAVAVSPRTPDGGRSLSPGYGPTQYIATQSALFGCHSAGVDCVVQDSMMNSCLAVAVDAQGNYSVAAGPTRTDATTAARGNLPRATAIQPFCSWDANNSLDGSP